MKDEHYIKILKKCSKQHASKTNKTYTKKCICSF